MSNLGVGAPWIAKSFQLDQSGIARLYAWIALSSLGALILSRLADRVGRRRIAVWCTAVTPFAALGAALSVTQVPFAIFEILLYALSGATVAAGVVMLAEELPIGLRAKGQSFGGLAMGLGSGVCVTIMPLLAGADHSWRWLLAGAPMGLLILPFLARIIPESQRWQRVAASGATARTHFYDVFSSRYRRRAVPVLVCSLIGTIASNAASSWSYFHAVSVVGLSAGAATLMVLAGGAVGMLGFPLGAWTCEHLGRVPTVVVSSLLASTGALGFYWGPPAHWALPTLWLGAGFAWFTAAGNALVVGGNSAITELFPTALRGTMIGWFALIAAVASVSSQAAIAVLAGPLGGLSTVVGYLALLAIPSAVIFGLFVDETRGLSLEAASKEA